MGWKSASDILLKIRKLDKDHAGDVIVTDKFDPVENRHDKPDSAENRKMFKEALLRKITRVGSNNDSSRIKLNYS